MQTNLADFVKNTSEGREAEAILRKCVHCGFCNATCPTYQLFGDELDGPRGRIYLIKEVLEGSGISRRTQYHLDRCLTCRACETTCPSGVHYSRLFEIGRNIVDEKIPRRFLDKARRSVLNFILPRPITFASLIKIARVAKPFLPQIISQQISLAADPGKWPKPRHKKKFLLHQGCVQRSLAPRINAAAARVLDKVGISLIPTTGSRCCGAINQHLGKETTARQVMRRNMDRLLEQLDSGAQGIVTTASACSLMFKEYADLFASDNNYSDKARQLTNLTTDISELVSNEVDLSPLIRNIRPIRVAFHEPCTLQHGQGLSGQVERILTTLGLELCAVPDHHICCGSAGTYSVMQPEISAKLRENKLSALCQAQPDVIATANIGCLTHLASTSHIPVQHWIEVVDFATSARNSAVKQ